MSNKLWVTVKGQKFRDVGPVKDNPSVFAGYAIDAGTYVDGTPFSAGTYVAVDMTAGRWEETLVTVKNRLTCISMRCTCGFRRNRPYHLDWCESARQAVIQAGEGGG